MRKAAFELKGRGGFLATIGTSGAANNGGQLPYPATSGYLGGKVRHGRGSAQG